jgi:hypothetical protein
LGPPDHLTYKPGVTFLSRVKEQAYESPQGHIFSTLFVTQIRFVDFGDLFVDGNCRPELCCLLAGARNSRSNFVGCGGCT